MLALTGFLVGALTSWIALKLLGLGDQKEVNEIKEDIEIE